MQLLSSYTIPKKYGKFCKVMIFGEKEIIADCGPPENIG